MAKSAGIEWCDSSANALVGCDGCELYNPRRPNEASCYAFHLVSRFAGKEVNGVKMKGWPEHFNKPAFFTERIQQAIRWKDLTGTKRPDKPWLDGMPRVIFLNDLGDTFTEQVNPDWLMEYVDEMEQSPHIWLILTKRPLRMLRFFARLGRVPDNFWPMTTVTGPFTKRRIEILQQIPSPHLGLSIEPLYGPLNLVPYFTSKAAKGRLHWAIVGGESHKERPRPMELAWKTDLIGQCADHQVAMFCKQLGSYQANVLGLADDKGGDWMEWEPQYRIRQMPQDTLLKVAA